MPWKEVSTMSQRIDFFHLWQSEQHSVAELCRIFGISRKTGYKWINRGLEYGTLGLHELSRKPGHFPTKTPEKVEKWVIQLRRAHPTWGGRKLKRALEDQGKKHIPSPSTITTILRRHNLLNTKVSKSNGSVSLIFPPMTALGRKEMYLQTTPGRRIW